MAKPNCKRAQSRSANPETDFPAVSNITAQAPDAVYDANGGPTAWRVLSLPEAERRARVQAAEQAESQRLEMARQRQGSEQAEAQRKDAAQRRKQAAIARTLNPQPVKPRKAPFRPLRFLTVTDSPGKAPMLRLLGRWLQEAGFEIGARTRIEIDAGRIVITLKKGD